MSSTASPRTVLETEEIVTLGTLTDRVGYHLRRASAAMNGDFHLALAGTGIRQVLFGILSVVAANPAINQGAVGRVLGIQRANMVALINELVDAGLIDRRTAVNDRRAFALALTEAGVAMVADCERRIDAHEAAMLMNFSAADRQMLIELLGRIEIRER